MIVPDEVRKCTVFLTYLDKKQNVRFAGTGFFVGVETEVGNFVHLVTAKHVIVEIRKSSSDGMVMIRFNTKLGGIQVLNSPVDEWNDHPSDSSVDISVLQCLPPPELEFMLLHESVIATEEIINRESIGLGAEVFITGLFVGHAGKNRNIPIIRAGNIAAMPEEKVDTQNFGSIDAYLIEARSIGGLSGSPVFVHLGNTRIVNGALEFTKNSRAGVFFLLGVMHGHWDREEPEKDAVTEDVDGGKVNMGIAIVVPGTKLLEIINQPKWVEARKVIVEEEKKKRLPVEDKNLPTQDSIESKETEKEGITKEEFEDALRKIARPLKKDAPKKKGT